MRKKLIYYVYILTNRYNTTFYIGVTNSISKRLFEHKFGLLEGFTKKYKVKKLVHLEEYSDIKKAIAREKQLKNWHRDWKINLIKKINPKFDDMSILD
ncbi:MAG: GIY-YIG nuclease family protein [Candidatus Levybacteria bacterium]|nr:GIY-YIG nuclease family protein [Candidatus Levybacteria bacterium]